MKRYYIPCAVDALLSFIFLGTAAYTVFLALKIRLLPAAVLAGGLGFFVAIGVFAFSLKKRSGLALKDDGKKILATMDILNVCTVSEIAEIFERAFNNMHIQATVEDEHIRLNGGAVIIPAFLPSPITANQLKLIVSPFLGKEKNIAVLSSAFDKEAAKYAKSLPISLFSAKETFEFLRRYGALPEYKKDKKQGFFTELASNIFQRKNAVKLIVYGSLIIIMAFFVFYPIYYYVFGGMFIVGGALSLIFAPSPTVKQNESLDTFLSGSEK